MRRSITEGGGEAEQGKTGEECCLLVEKDCIRRGGEDRREEERRRGGEEGRGEKRRVGAGNHRYVQDGGWVAFGEDSEKVELWESRATGIPSGTNMHPLDRNAGRDPCADKRKTPSCLWERSCWWPEVQSRVCARQWKGEATHSWS